MVKNLLIVGLVVLLVVVAACVKHCGTDRAGSTAGSNSEGGKPPATRPSDGLPRLVELGAGKCQACKAMAPIIEQLRKEYAGRIEVESVDVMEDRERAREIDFNLIPSQVFFDAAGKELWRHEGFMPKDQIEAKFAELKMK